MPDRSDLTVAPKHVPPTCDALSIARVLLGSAERCGSGEVEDGQQGGVDPPLFFRSETAGQVPESLKTDGSHVFDEHAGQRALDLDLGSERRRLGSGRCRRHQHHRSGQEGVGLHDDTEAAAVLLVSYSFGKPESEDVTPAHADSP